MGRVASEITQLRSILVPYFSKDTLITARAVMVRPSWWKIDKTKLAIKWHGMPPRKDWTEQTISEIKVQCTAILSHILLHDVVRKQLGKLRTTNAPDVDLSWLNVEHLENLYKAIGSKK